MNFEILTETDMVVYVISLGFSLLALSLAFGIFSVYKKLQKNASYSSQLEEILNDFDDEVTARKNGPSVSKRWNDFWGERLKKAGWARYENDNSTAGRDILITLTVVFFLSLLFFSNILLALATPVTLAFGVSMFAQIRAEKQATLIDDQITGFLYSLRANLLSSDVLENAFQRVVPSLENPIRAELEIASNHIKSGKNFREAISLMSQKTASNEMKFLCSCMIQASAHGASLEKQIERIIENVKKRQIERNLISRAEGKMRFPTIVSIFIIPVIFVATSLASPATREYWADLNQSYIGLILSLILWVLSIYLVRRMIRKIKNL